MTRHDTSITIRTLPKGIYLAPEQGLRVWLWLISQRAEIVTTTPGKLWADLRDAGIKISRRSMTRSLDGLAAVGAITFSRNGHLLKIATGADCG